ncbi:MAG: ROK family transcriptional regulator [Erysipelotrichaceae bacterium]|nr:ROK family transcriptional regulator [Erysipelotrichaceae bacterium]
MKVTDILGIREQNIASIINAVRFKSGISKKQIAEETELSVATVSNLCNDLAARNILIESKNDGLSVGRTPSVYTFNVERYCVLAINLQLRNVMYLAITNFRNEIILEKEYKYSDNAGVEEIMHEARVHYEEDLKPGLRDDAVIIGVGVAVSAIYDTSHSKLVCCAIPVFEEKDLKKITEKEFGLTAYIDNEANLCAIAANASEAEYEDIVYIHASEGVGTGIIQHGRLLQGHNGYAGEISHMPIGRPDRKCKVCGRYGCIESDLSIDGFLLSYFGNNRGKREERWKEFLEAVEAKKEKALKVTEETGTYLGRLVSVLIYLFDPQVVYIGGNIPVLYPYMKESMMKEVRGRCVLWDENSIAKILPDLTSNERIIIGISERICSKWLPY